jgi:hypothetical protein
MLDTTHRVTMTRFIAGIAVTIAVQLLGWPRIEAAFKAAGAHTQAAYSIAEDKLRASEVAK